MNAEGKSLVVRQANELIEASYKIASIGEGRLMRMLIAQISPTDEDFKTYRISVSDFARFFNLTSKRVNEQVEKSARALRDREILIRNGKSWFSTGWLSHAEYIHGSGYVEVSFHARLKPYLLGLKSYFTQYELEDLIKFKSGYAIRLFELLKKEQFKANEKGCFERRFGYEELRAILGVEKTDYVLFADFRINVVQTATDEINANSDLNVRTEYEKTGRKVSHIVFRCEKAKGGKPPSLEPPQNADGKEHPEDVRERVAMGMEEATAYRWRKKYGVKRIVRNAAYAQAMQKAGKIKQSLSGYLSRAIADDIASGWEAEHKKKTEEKKRAADAEELKRREEEEKAEANRKEREAVLAEFHALPESEQEAVRAAFVASEKFRLYARWWDKAKADGKSKPETLPQTSHAFRTFYAAYKSGSQDAT